MNLIYKSFYKHMVVNKSKVVYSKNFYNSKEPYYFELANCYGQMIGLEFAIDDFGVLYRRSYGIGIFAVGSGVGCGNISIGSGVGIRAYGCG